MTNQLDPAVWVVMAFAIAWAFMVLFTALFNCHPIQYNWNKSLDGGCDNEKGAWVGVAVLDIAVDLAILILPVRGVWKLQMPQSIKFALSGAFALGFADVAVGILRVVVADRVDFQGNWSLQTGPVYFWSTLEPGLAIIVASGVVLRPIIEKIMPARFLSLSHFYHRKPHQSREAYSRFGDGIMTLNSLNNDFSHGDNRQSKPKLYNESSSAPSGYDITSPPHQEPYSLSSADFRESSPHIHRPLAAHAKEQGDTVHVQREIRVEKERV